MGSRVPTAPDDGLFSDTLGFMAAAKARTLLSLAAFCLPALANIPRGSLVTEKPHLGVENFAVASRLGLAAANALIAPGIARCLYDSGRRSRNTGKERDAETGLDFFESRYFSGAQGRFTSPDEPLADQWSDDPQSWNLYGYVRNNPLKFQDPTGRDCIYTNEVNSNGTVGISNERGGCSESGGTYVPGTVDRDSLYYNANAGTVTYGYTPYDTSANYSFGSFGLPDPGIQALQRGMALATPGVELAGQGLLMYASAVSGPGTAAVECAAKGKDCSPTDIAMAMFPGGGGKTGRKVNQKAYEAAKESVEMLRRVLKRIKETPNKTPATAQAEKIVEGRLKDATERLKKSEPHGISGQGPGR